MAGVHPGDIEVLENATAGEKRWGFLFKVSQLVIWLELSWKAQG